MSAPILRRRVLVGATIETTSGTAATVTASLAGAFYSTSANADDQTSEGERMPDGLYMGQVKAETGKKTGRVEFEQDLTESSGFFTLLQGCGYLSDTGYKPKSDVSANKTLTIKVWEDGRVKQLRGCAGNLVMTLTAGKVVRCRWSFQGIWDGLQTDASMPATSPVSADSFVARGATVTLNAAALPCWQTMTIDTGNTVSQRECLTNAAGVLHYLVSERKPKITIDPEATLKTTLDNYGLMDAGTEHALAIDISSTTNTFSIDAPLCQRRVVTDGERNGIRLDVIELHCNASSGDDELVFAEA